eukprot:1602080-Rhodomonas_salina.1
MTTASRAPYALSGTRLRVLTSGMAGPARGITHLGALLPLLPLPLCVGARRAQRRERDAGGRVEAGAARGGHAVIINDDRFIAATAILLTVTGPGHPMCVAAVGGLGMQAAAYFL